jgi:hypothetical protein
MNGVLFKIDFEKAYDQVNWSFLQQALCMKGFDDKWCLWIQNFVKRDSVGIRVNEDIGHYFQTHKGLRQSDCGDPAYHCMCSIQVVDITPMKHRLTSITSLRVVQQKHHRSKA